MDYVYYNGELYHYGVKGMKWGVRRSPEVQEVNKRYKEELKPYQKELNRKNRSVTIKKMAYDHVIGDNVLTRIGAYADKKVNRREYKQQKKELQKKYEPEFQKAQKKAEARLAKEKAQKNTPEAIAKRKETGKKAAIGAVAAIGTLTVATLLADSTLKQQYGISPREAFKLAKAASKL